MPIGVATPVVEKDRVFFTSFYDGSLMLRLLPDKPRSKRSGRSSAATRQNTAALHSIISTPVFENGYIYGVDSYGELRCLDAQTGDRLWEDHDGRAQGPLEHDPLRQERRPLFAVQRARRAAHRQALAAGLSRKSAGRSCWSRRRTSCAQRGGVCWSHPAFANKHIFARNDKELVCASLAAE